MTNLITVFDTETTNLPKWKTPSGDEKQPHLVSLTAIQCNEDTEEVVQRIDLIVKSEGWESHEKAFAVHGITKEYSIEVGVPEREAVSLFISLCLGSKRTSFNRTFDQRIIRIALKRYAFDESLIDSWEIKDDVFPCTMQESRKIMGCKTPTLEEAYRFFCGKTLGDKAHSAIYDTEACMEIYFAMKKYIPAPPIEVATHPCPVCKNEWDSMKIEACPHCGNEIPF